MPAISALPDDPKRISFACCCGKKLVANSIRSGKRLKCRSCGRVVVVPTARAGLVPTPTRPASEPFTNWGHRLSTIVHRSLLWSLPFVLAVGGGAIIHFLAKGTQQARIEVANTEVREALKEADDWLRLGSAMDAENVEHRLMKAITANDVSEKGDADVLLETVRMRRAELAADYLLDSAKTKLDALAIVDGVALLRQYVGDPHATKELEAKQLLADCDLATSDDAALQTLMAMSDERFAQFRIAGTLDDQKITHRKLAELREGTLRRNLEPAGRRRHEIKIAEENRQKSERLAREAARRVIDDVAGTWRHRPGNSASSENTLYPSGKINDPNGPNTWTIRGKTLVLFWASPQAPGGFWIDTCTVSDDGETYSGANQHNVPIVGWKVTRPVSAANRAGANHAEMKQRPNDPLTVRYVEQQIGVLVGTGPLDGRRQAAENLAALGPAASGTILRLSEVALSDPDTSLRRKAIEALGELGLPQGIIAAGLAFLQTQDPEIGKAAANALVNLLPALGKHLTMEEAFFLLQVHDSGNKRVALAVESVMDIKGLVTAAKEIEKRRLQKERDAAYWAKEDAKRRLAGKPTREELLLGARARRDEMFRGPQNSSPFGPNVPWKPGAPQKSNAPSDRNSYDPMKGGTPQKPNNP